MNLQDLAKRIECLEDIEAIKQLKARYCTICDDNHNPDRITSIFSETGEWEGRGIGHAKGHLIVCLRSRRHPCGVTVDRRDGFAPR